jgi:hypothetical protein
VRVRTERARVTGVHDPGGLLPLASSMVVVVVVVLRFFLVFEDRFVAEEQFQPLGGEVHVDAHGLDQQAGRGRPGRIRSGPG